MPRRPHHIVASTVTGLLAALAMCAGAVATAGSAVAVEPAGTLTIEASPSPISTVDLTQPHAVSITVRCATAIGTLTVTMTRPDGVVTTIQPGVTVAGTVKGFDVSVTPAAHGDYVFAATSSGCGTAPSAIVTATGPDVTSNIVTSPGQLSASDFAATGVAFTGTGFHAGVTLAVTSTVPGFIPTSITTDAAGAFGFVQTGAAGTANGYYSTSFSGRDDGVAHGTFLIGTAPPTTSDPHLTLSTHRLTLSQYLATGVTASATGYAPGDLVLANERVASGNVYFRGTGAPDAAGGYSVSITGAANANTDRLGVHTVTFSSFNGPDASDTFEVVADPLATVAVSPDPVEQGTEIRFAFTGLVPGASYLVLPDQALANGNLFVVVADPVGEVVVDGSVPSDYPLGAHTARVFKIGVPAGPLPTIAFTVIAPLPVVTVDPTSVVQGDSITVSGAKFAPNTSYALHFDSPIDAAGVDPHVVTDAVGTFRLPFAVPADYPVGDHSVTATAAPTLLASATPGGTTAVFTVRASASSPVIPPTTTPPTDMPLVQPAAPPASSVKATRLARTGGSPTDVAAPAAIAVALGLAGMALRLRASRRETSPAATRRRRV